MVMVSVEGVEVFSGVKIGRVGVFEIVVIGRDVEGRKGGYRM